jgi:hypothetical protein
VQTYTWHHGAMLYYVGEYDQAIEYLTAAARRYEKLFDAPATEERMWMAAALTRLHGA